MIRALAFAVVLSWSVTSASAQVQPSPPAAASGTSAPKPAAKKPAARDKAAASRPAPVESGPCHIGVISAIGDKFAVQKVGLTVFGNELTEVPIGAWGLDDLVIARVRAAASGINVRRIAHSKGAFEPYYNPPTRLFRNSDEDLTAVIKQVTSSSNCTRYFAFTTFTGQLQGTNQSLSGIGVLFHGAGPLSNTYLFANFALTVFDGQSFIIAKRPSANIGAILAGSFGRLGQDPLSKLEAEEFPASAGDAAASSNLRNRTRALLAARLDKAVAPYLKQE